MAPPRRPANGPIFGKLPPRKGEEKEDPIFGGSGGRKGRSAIVGIDWKGGEGEAAGGNKLFLSRENKSNCHLITEGANLR